MIIAPLPANEEERINALKAYHILDTRPEAGFDALTSLASMICDTQISLVSLIDHDRQWFKSNQGLPEASETPRDIAFCTHAILGDELLEVNDAVLDNRFYDNPLVTGDPKIRFYAGMPLINDAGYALGTLCVIDRQPKSLSETQRKALADLARAVVSLIDAKKGSYRLLQVIEHAPYGALILSDQQVITAANPTLTKMLGFYRDDLVGLKLDQLVSPFSLDHKLATTLSADELLRAAKPDQQFVLSAQGRLIPIETFRSDIGDGFCALIIIDLSERFAMAESAAKSRDELQKIIDQMPALIGYWDRNLRNRFGNKSYLEWFGFTPEQMKGQYLRDVIGERLFELNQPYIQGALKGQPQMVERNLVDPQGRKRSTLASFVPDVVDGVVEGFFVFTNDITPLKDAEHARIEAEAQLQAVFDSAIGLSIIATDLEGRIKIFSRGAELMLGYSADEVINQQTPLIFHDPAEIVVRQRALIGELGHTIEGIDILMHRVRTGGVDKGEWSYCRKDGTRFWVDLVVSGIRSPSGELVGFLGLAHDISEQKHYQHSLAAAADAAQAASQAKSAFVANMSHEIRTPMNAVLGMTQLLGKMPMATQQRKYVDMIRAAGESLLFIINDILDFSKIEAGKLEIEHKPFQLEQILRDASSIMMVHAAEKPIELVVDLDPDIPRELIGDGMRLQQVLTNLATNAAKFTSQGEISTRVQLVKLSASQARVRFELKDSGIGMLPEQQSKLFTPFTQADTSTTRRYGGTGLGLVICKHLITLMHGQLGLESEFGVGSTFWFELSFDMPQYAPALMTPPGLSPQHVLLVEDNDYSSQVLAQIIRGWGWRVDVAFTARRMVELYQQQGQTGKNYDLVIADISALADDTVASPLFLPKMFQSIPVVITLNSYERQLLERPAYQDWIKTVMVKPVTPSTLIDSILEALGQRAPETHTQPPAAETSVDVVRSSQISGLHILVVEDNAFNQVVAQGLLENCGAQVEIASNGQEAVDILRTRHSTFDLVLMDVQMPVMDGFQATRYIRGELGLHLPIIAMSAGVLLAEREQCTAVGMNDFIAKPIDVSQMLAVIARSTRSEAASLSPSPAAVSRLDTFNIDDLAEFYRSSKAGIAPLCDLLERFTQRGSSVTDQLQAAWARGETREMMSMLHSARGSYGTVGAKQFAHLAQVLEHSLANDEHDQVEAQLTQLVLELQAVQREMNQWLTQQKSIAAPSDDSADGDVSLAQFKVSLAAFNMNAYELYPQMRKVLLKRHTASDLAIVDQYMESLQFPQVLAWLEAHE